MNYDTWKSTDVAADYEDGIARAKRRDAEDEREARWAEFVEWAKFGRMSVLLKHVADLMDGHRDPYYRLPMEILNFQETEGWSGVLAALARAIRETEGA